MRHRNLSVFAGRCSHTPEKQLCPSDVPGQPRVRFASRSKAHTDSVPLHHQEAEEERRGWRKRAADSLGADAELAAGVVAPDRARLHLRPRHGVRIAARHLFFFTLHPNFGADVAKR